jgi:hypothetical protein
MNHHLVCLYLRNSVLPSSQVLIYAFRDAIPRD